MSGCPEFWYTQTKKNFKITEDNQKNKQNIC